MLIDKGAGGEEAERVERAIAGLPNIRCWNGSFAPSRPRSLEAASMSGTIPRDSTSRRRAVFRWSACSQAFLRRGCSRAGVRWGRAD